MERRQNITVSIEGIQLPLTVKTEEEEKIYRDAASMIQDRLQKLRDLYPTLPNEKYYYASNRANMGPVLDIINDLNKDIEAITAKK